MGCAHNPKKFLTKKFFCAHSTGMVFFICLCYFTLYSKQTGRSDCPSPSSNNSLYSTILRSIPNKLGGVIALALAVIILYILPFYGRRKFKGLRFYPFGKRMF